MPRKQNGFGSSKSFSVGSVNNKIDQGKKVLGSGQYPSNRQYGTTVTRSVIQKYNLDSTWTMWARGYEYARLEKWVALTIPFPANLFSGTQGAIRANFECKRYPSSTNDNLARYAVQRIVSSHASFGNVSKIINNKFSTEKQVLDNFRNKEIWLQMDKDSVRPELYRLSHERITNKPAETDYTKTKTFEATVKTVRKADGKPGIYTCNNRVSEAAEVIRIPRSEVVNTDIGKKIIAETGNTDALCRFLEGQVIRTTQLPTMMSKEGIVLKDDPEDFNKILIEMDMQKSSPACYIAIVDNQSALDIFVDVSPKLFLTTTNAKFEMNQEFVIHRDVYQPYFEGFLTKELIDSETNNMSLLFPPLFIDLAVDDGTDFVFKTIPFEAQLWLYAVDDEPYLVLSDFSFTSHQVIERSRNGTILKSNDPLTLAVRENIIRDLNVNPWQDQTFVAGDGIYLADQYACNCQSYSKAIVRAPEEFIYPSSQGVKRNRQLRYPLPSSGSNKDKTALGNNTAGSVLSWASANDRLKYKTCKHTMATEWAKDKITVVPNPNYNPNKAISKTNQRFITNRENLGYQIYEPTTKPALEILNDARQKIAKEIVDTDFGNAAAREKISEIDLGFSILQLLNLMDVEIGYILGRQRAIFPVGTMEEGIITE